MDDKLPPPCVSCKHYYRPFRYAITGERARCSKFDDKDRYDVVTGKMAKISFFNLPTCRDVRMADPDYNGNACGYEARFWTPKHTSDVFQALRHMDKALKNP